jgi:FixJ family two-component response regulator
MNPQSPNIYLVDDDDAVRRSLGGLLLSRLNDCSVQTFASGEAFLEQARVEDAGVAVLDLRMQGMSGLDVFKALQDQRSPLVVVFLSGHGDIPVAVRAIQEGALGWLEKPCSEDRLIVVMQQAKERAVAIALERIARQDALDLWARLTPRERQVAQPLARGKSSKLIAQELSQRDPSRPLDFRTVETHRASIFSKLGVANSNGLLLFLGQHGLLDSA